MASSQKADIGYKSNSSNFSNPTSKNSKPATHKKVNNAIHKTEAKKIPMKYNKNISMDPMPESLLKSKIFFKMFYSFLFVHELNKTEVIVASYIYTFYEHTKAVFAKSSTLGKYLNIDKGQISRILNHLVELEIVKKETQGKNTLYTPLLDPDDLTQFACELGSKVFTEEDKDEIYIKDNNEEEIKEIKKAESTPQPTSLISSTPSQSTSPSQSTAPTSQPLSAPKPKPKLPPLPPEIQAQLASDNFDMIYYDIPPYYNPNKIDELNLRPYNLRFGIYTYPKPGDSNFDVSDRTSPYYDPEDDPDNDAYWDWSDDIPVPKKKARQTQQIQQAQAKTTTTATTTTKLDSKTDTIKPAASASNNTAYWR